MGDITLVQLLDNARRQSDGAAERQWTPSDWLALPVVVVFILVMVAWVLVAGVADAIRRLFLRPVKESSILPCPEQAEP